MKSFATTLLAGLMIVGAASGIAMSKNTNNVVGFSDGGPAPLCRPTDPNCPDPIPPAAR